MTAALLLLGGGCAVLLLWWCAEAVHRHPAWGAGALFGWLAVQTACWEHGDWFSTSVGGVTVAVPDVLAAFLALVAALRFARGLASVPSGMRLPLLVLGGAIVLAYLRGVAAFGVQHATNEFREFFYFLSALAFAASFPFDRLGRILPGLATYAGIVLLAVAGVRLALAGELDLDHRPLPSFGALALADAFILSWFWVRGARSFFWRALPACFLAAAFLMLHRSVWMSLAAGIALLLLSDGAGRRRLVRLLGVGAAAVALLAAVFLRAQLGRSIDSAVTEATSKEDSTFIWRLQGWAALLSSDNDGGLVNDLAGRPMGTGYARVLGDSVVGAAQIDPGVIPHNYYLSLFLRGGIVGLAAFLWLLVRIGAALWQGRRRLDHDGAEAFLALLAVQVVYDLAYSADPIQGLVLGCAVSLVAACARSRSRASEPLVACLSPS